MKKLLLLAIVVLGISAVSFGQGRTDVATSTATIITPITITKKTNLNFGNIAINNLEGTVTLPAVSGTPQRQKTGGATLPAVTGTVTAADFVVTGLATSVYTISVPSTIPLSDGDGHTINFVPAFSPATLSTLTAGDNHIYVGGLLTIPGGTVAGTYSNTTDLKVTVDYN